MALLGNWIFEACTKSTRILADGTRPAARCDETVLEICLFLSLRRGNTLPDPERMDSHAAVAEAALLLTNLGPVLTVQARRAEPAINANTAVTEATADSTLVLIAHLTHDDYRNDVNGG